jgi:ABC-type Fe3+-hydroxamate transport system substrate-binding protein
MPNIPDNPSVARILRKIAFINVQKFPGNTTSKNNLISLAYRKDKDILLEQIKVYNPDVIIFGYTIKNFLVDLGLEEKDRNYDENNYWIKDNKIYIDAFHPAKEKSEDGKEYYIDDIARIVKNNT